MKTKIFSILTILILVLVLAGCGSSKTEPTEASTPEATTMEATTTVSSTTAENQESTETTTTAEAATTSEAEVIFTLEDLAKYNGKSGMAPYIAYEGVVYDLSAVKEWKNGEHNGMVAGTDATKLLMDQRCLKNYQSLAN